MNIYDKIVIWVSFLVLGLFSIFILYNLNIVVYTQKIQIKMYEKTIEEIAKITEITRENIDRLQTVEEKVNICSGAIIEINNKIDYVCDNINKEEPKKIEKVIEEKKFEENIDRLLIPDLGEDSKNHNMSLIREDFAILLDKHRINMFEDIEKLDSYKKKLWERDYNKFLDNINKGKYKNGIFKRMFK